MQRNISEKEAGDGPLFFLKKHLSNFLFVNKALFLVKRSCVS